MQPAYHRYLKRTYGQRLPEAPAPVFDSYPPATLLEFMERVAARHELCYLHPSFGYYFERFYLVPRGLVYEMKLGSTNSLEMPALPAERIKEQEQYWSRLEAADLNSLVDKVSHLTRREKESAYNLQWTASFYSRACDHWGTLLQAAGLNDQAEHFYQQALKLNAENACAFVNLEWCQHWKKTGKLLERFSDETMSRLAPYAGNWDLLLSINGPVDEPTFRLELARVLSGNNQCRQAAAQVQRVLAVDPKQVPAHLLMGSLFVQANMPERALELVSRLRADTALMSAESSQLGLIQVEAWAYYVKGELARAETLLKSAQAKYAQEEGAFFTLAQMYLAQAEQSRAQGKQSAYLQSMTNALGVFETQTKAQPKNLSALVNYGGLCAQLEDYKRAIIWLSRALELEPNNPLARLNRAISELRSGRDDEAVADYQQVLKLNPTAYRAYFGLAEIAARKEDWRSVMEHCEFYLKHAPSETAEYAAVEKRLAEAKRKARW